jgi:hypothetical protein
MSHSAAGLECSSVCRLQVYILVKCDEATAYLTFDMVTWKPKVLVTRQG